MAPRRIPPTARLKRWLTANWQFVRHVKAGLMMGFFAEMIFASFAGAFDPETARSLHGISFEMGVLFGLYLDPDEWQIP